MNAFEVLQLFDRCGKSILMYSWITSFLRCVNRQFGCSFVLQSRLYAVCHLDEAWRVGSIFSGPGWQDRLEIEYDQVTAPFIKTKEDAKQVLEWFNACVRRRAQALYDLRSVLEKRAESITFNWLLHNNNDGLVRLAEQGDVTLVMANAISKHNDYNRLWVRLKRCKYQDQNTHICHKCISKTLNNCFRWVIYAVTASHDGKGDISFLVPMVSLFVGF